MPLTTPNEQALVEHLSDDALDRQLDGAREKLAELRELGEAEDDLQAQEALVRKNEAILEIRAARRSGSPTRLDLAKLEAVLTGLDTPF